MFYKWYHDNVDEHVFLFLLSNVLMVFELLLIDWFDNKYWSHNEKKAIKFLYNILAPIVFNCERIYHYIIQVTKKLQSMFLCFFLSSLDIVATTFEIDSTTLMLCNSNKSSKTWASSVHRLRINYFFSIATNSQRNEWLNLSWIFRDWFTKHIRSSFNE